MKYYLQNIALPLVIRGNPDDWSSFEIYDRTEKRWDGQASPMLAADIFIGNVCGYDEISQSQAVNIIDGHAQ